MTLVSDILIGVCVAAWIVSFLLPVAIPRVHVDASISLVLMAIVGALIAVRQRKGETP